MKRNFLMALTFAAAAAFATAQAPTTDVLGAHLNYGRGCAACHAPHSGVYGNGNAKTADPASGNLALWGEDVTSLKGVSITTGQSEHGSYVEALPQLSDYATRPDVAGVLMCLSCHDGNFAQGAMMKNQVYETLPASYGTANKIPTLLGNDGQGATGNYLNDHPVGTQAVMSCGGKYDWDCTISGAKVNMTGTNSAKFVTNYGFFVRPGNYNNAPVVLCTTCHNQHLMNVVNVSATATNTGLAPGPYATMFFLRGPYNPASAATGANTTAQFCRQCHGGEANEMNGSTAVTIF